MCKSVIGVTGAFNHSNTLIHKDLQACDWVIGKKATFWGKEIIAFCGRHTTLQNGEDLLAKEWTD